MKKSEARQIFRERICKRIDNETYYLRIKVDFDESKQCFTDDRGKKVSLPKDFIKYTHTTDLIVDLKKYRILNWKPEYGFVHLRIDVGYNGEYELLNEIGECFCTLRSWPPNNVVPSKIDFENKKAIIEFDIQEDGKLRNWPAPADFSIFKKSAVLHFTNDDKKWIIEQMDNPDGDPIIKYIPYKTSVGGYTEDDYMIDERDFVDFRTAMDFVRALRNNPECDYIHARTASGWNVDFWRHSTYTWDNENGEEEEYEDEQTSFSHIEEWINEELFNHVKRFLLPDDIDLEVEEMNDLFGGDDNKNEEYSDDLPF